MTPIPVYQPQGLSLEIFTKRHALHPQEGWLLGCERVAGHVAMAETGEDIPRYRAEFYDVLSTNLFMPGGRIWYGSGRPKGQLLNCFVAPTADSREGWGKTTSDLIVICGTGGGLGINFSPVRPRGTDIHGTGGKATGSVSLMKLENAGGEIIKAGGGRRTALMFALSLTHGDIEEFLDAKLDLSQLNNANVSVVFDTDPEEFFEKVRNDRPYDLMFQGRVIGSIPAKKIWSKIIRNALKGGEPGLLNGYYANKMSNIWYYAPLISTNPCFAPGTLVQTKTGHFPIESLVGNSVEVWDGLSWVSCDNFRVTGENQEMLRITMHDGSFERVTPYHKCILEDGTRLEARHLLPGMKLKFSEAPHTHGAHQEPGAYLKGFLAGDGTVDTTRDAPILLLYVPKYSCAERLIQSAEEIVPTADLHTNGVSEPSFCDTDTRDRRAMRGLTARRAELLPWVTDFKKRLPVEVFGWDRESKLEFIAGAMDADGTAQDSSGCRYQICSIEKPWLLDFQRLLKTIGVPSKLGLMTKGTTKDFGSDRGGVYQTQDCWRLTVSQIGAIALAEQVTFSRLQSFADRRPVYTLESRDNRIVSIEPDGIEEKVYCCTIDSTHSVALSSGLLWGQCGEIWLEAYGCCCLGALVLPRFATLVRDDEPLAETGCSAEFNWALLKKTIGTAVRFLDNVLTVNNYPLPEIRENCNDLRRIGLGVMGLHDLLLMMGLKYSSDDGLEFVNKLMGFIKNAAYEASIDLAKEKGSFPKFNADKFLKSGFCKTLKPSVRSKIWEHGIRNCALLTIAPTGTTSMECAVSSGVEPMFAAAYRRKYRDGDALKEEIVVHPLFKQFVEEGRDVSHFQGAHDLAIRDHFEMQRVCQRHLDNACSKTINLPHGTSEEELSELYMEFFPELKGVTVYPDGSRENQPLTPMSLDEAMRHLGESGQGALSADACRNGSCDI